MSNEVSAIAKRRKVGNATAKAVLNYMADSASDDGSGIWTSKANIAADLEISKRSVQLSIKLLIEKGVVSEVGKRSCKNGFTYEYAINIPALKALEKTREPHSPVNHIHPSGEPHSPQEVNHIHPNHTGTIQEPSLLPPVSPKRDSDLVLEALTRWASHSAATSFIAFRRKQKGKALSVVAAERLANNLAEIFNAGGNPDDALGLAEERGWQSIKPEWYFREQQQQQPRHAGRGFRSGTVDAFAEVARERHARSSGYDY